MYSVQQRQTARGGYNNYTVHCTVYNRDRQQMKGTITIQYSVLVQQRYIARVRDKSTKTDIFSKRKIQELYNRDLQEKITETLRQRNTIQQQKSTGNQQQRYTEREITLISILIYCKYAIFVVCIY